MRVGSVSVSLRFLVFLETVKACSSQNLLASNILCEAYLRLRVRPIAIIRRFYDDEDC